MTLEVIIMAAGEGTRMRASRAKTLHIIGDKPMLWHVLCAANELRPTKMHIVVSRAHGDAVKDAIAQLIDQQPEDARSETKHSATNRIDANRIGWATQSESLGTGHAANQAMPAVARDATVLLLYGDTPLLSANTLAPLTATAADNKLALLTAEPDDANGLGRIVRNARNEVIGIVEQRDATAAQLNIGECNTGVIAAPAKFLARALDALDNNNAQKEFYLTDIVARAAADGIDIIAQQPAHIADALGVNTPLDLARAERVFQLKCAHQLLADGVRLRDAARFDLRGRAQFGRDCEIDVNVLLVGETAFGDGCTIGANCIVRNSRIGDGCTIDANCIIDNAHIGARCRIGPFARLRPHSELGDEVHVGNFVEIKNSRLDDRAKANHLSYIGDAEIGAGGNIGAGVITCNYDGADKHRTRIGADVFVGSNSQLVAPLSIGDGATIGAGSTVTRDVPASTLSVARARQRNVTGWTRPTKKSARK